MQPSRCAVLADATPQRLLYFGGAVGAGDEVGAGAPRQSAAWPGCRPRKEDEEEGRQQDGG